MAAAGAGGSGTDDGDSVSGEWTAGSFSSRSVGLGSSSTGAVVASFAGWAVPSLFGAAGVTSGGLRSVAAVAASAARAGGGGGAPGSTAAGPGDPAGVTAALAGA